MLPEVVVACANGNFYEPMLERCVHPVTIQFPECLDENLLDDVLDFAFLARIFTRCGKNPSLISSDERLKASGVASQDVCASSEERSESGVPRCVISENKTLACNRLPVSSMGFSKALTGRFFETPTPYFLSDVSRTSLVTERHTFIDLPPRSRNKCGPNRCRHRALDLCPQEQWLPWTSSY